MPIWKIFHHPSIFTSPTEKQSLAQTITDWYSPHIPAYYVNVQFWALPEQNYYTKGQAVTRTVFVEILHVARHMDLRDKARVQNMKDSFDRILKPYTIDKGLHLEWAIQESPAELWRINGIDPPESFGPGVEEQRQAAVNRKRLDELRKNPGSPRL